MEKEAFFGNSTVINWQKQAPDAAASLPKPNSGHLNLIWDQTIDQSAKFGSALSSLVSSPSSNPPAAAAGGDSVVIRELIGRLGSICNSDEISASPHHRSANNSCYSTPMNSPPKLNLSIVPNPAQMPFSTDPGFVERAQRCSTFGCNGGGSHGGGQFMFPVVGKLGNAQDESSGSGNTKKRKAAMKAKGKEAPLSSSITAVTNPPKKAGVGGLNAKTPKRSKPLEETGIEKEPADAASKKIEEDKGTKPPEVTKDYIHVRARRGQATDSHSLAERVRREKISERMKLLQDLVPGCSKVTGKAVMLDEIINYVQLLQRQVEFLSMKLATVNPQLDFNLENFVTKDMEIQNCALLPPQTGYPLEATSNSYSFANQTDRAPLISINGLELESQVNHFSHHPNLSRNSLIMQQPPLEGFADTSCQLGAFWDDDLRTVVQMGFSQNQGSVSSSHMEVGL